MLSMIFLSDAERAQLKIQHRHERDGRIRDRIKAVLLFDKGWSISAIAEALLLSEDAIRDHITEYKEFKKLKPENEGIKMLAKSCALNTSPRLSFIDHIAPLASLLNIPLIVSDEKNAQLTSQYYPEVDLHYWPDFEFRLKELSDRFDALFSCDYWTSVQRNAFQLYNKKVMKLLFCPHGQSDKGYNSSFLAPYAWQEGVLLYGDLMKEMLIDLKLWNRGCRVATVGNFRRRYYEKHRERLLRMAREEIFSKLNLANRTLFFAPTWNDYERSGTFFEYGERLLRELPSEWNLVIKVHPDVVQHDPVLYYRLSLMEEKRANFLLIEDFPPIYPILEIVDVYLGDYSSIGYDFLAFQKPMFFLQKPHLVGARLHTCGPVLDPSTPLFPSIEKLLPQAHEFREAQESLYRRAFREGSDIVEALQPLFLDEWQGAGL